MERRPQSVLPVMGSTGNAAEEAELLSPNVLPVHQGIQIGRVAEGIHLGAERVSIGCIFVPIDSVANFPERGTKLAFFLALDLNPGHRDDQAGKNEQDGRGHDEFDQSKTGLFSADAHLHWERVER